MSAPTIRIRLEAYDHQALDVSSREIVDHAKRTGAKVAGPVPLPTRREIYTVNRSTFVNKKSREQFEIRTHKRIIDINDANARTIEALNRLGYLQTDANTIITAAFAIGTLLVTLKKSRKAQGVNVVMYALLLCVAFVIPSSEAPATSRTSIIIRTCQKVCLNYAIGFIISGITLDLVT